MPRIAKLRIAAPRPAALALILAAGALPAGAGTPGALTLDFPGAPASFAPVAGGAGITRFSMLDAIGIEGAAGAARLVIEIALPPGAGPGTAPVDARVTYRPDGFRDYWQTAAPARDEAITLTRVELAGPAPRIAGRFRVTLCRRADVIAPPDLARCHEAEGGFDTILQPD